ncbi:MAG TPA: ribonuclease P protein component [Candidatus Saccharimonadales bacterium]|nr:ribonuclease P protein component [Candidatus Saccharimonadales bacterium]
MISGTHRFHGRNSLRYVYQRGKTVRGPELALRFAHNNRCKSYRLAVVVSRKVSKSAVVRNRIRRRIYEIVRTHADAITEPYDLIFTVYDEVAAVSSHQQLKRSVLGCLERAAVLNPSHYQRVIIEEKENT